MASAAYGYDADGNLTSLTYSRTGNASVLPSYTWTYDALGNVLTAWNNTDGTVTYTNDSTGQLTSATGGPAPNESYTYDANGNRTSGGDVTGPNNELLYDGTYNYEYDPEGNLIARWVASNTSETQPGPGDSSITIYTWDNRNRLTSVTQYGSYANMTTSPPAPTQTVTYTYDALNRWVGETITPSSGQATQTRFIYDGNQILMQFDGNSSPVLTAGQAEGTPLAAGSLSHRYLWGPAVDQLLADEQVSGLTSQGSVLWALTDNQNTVRDLATFNGSNTTVVNHRVFSAFGQLLSQNPSAAADCLFAFTGRPMSVFSENGTGAVTGLQNNGNRWYDAITGRWLSQDPIGFEGGGRQPLQVLRERAGGWDGPKRYGGTDRTHQRPGVGSDYRRARNAA